MPALDQWEKRLKPYFSRSLQIVGEIPLTRADVEDMIEGVRACIHRHNLVYATDLMTKKYPHLFLACLAGFAAHNTEQAYWIALAGRLGVNHNQLFNHRWHYAFQQEVRRRNMAYFDYEGAYNPFVTTIRFHGGIPAYSLPDFFERLLLPTVKRPALREVSTKQAMQTVLQTAYFVDSPVINFLENSGSLGEKFFDACRKMARHYLQSQGDLLPAAELNLPEYVVEAFGEFMERSAEDGQSLRLRKPLLGANPFGDLDRVWLKLPEQEIDLRYAAGALEWRIEWPGMKAPMRVECEFFRRRQYTYVKEEFFPIQAAPYQIAVSLVYTDDKASETLRRWTLPLAPLPGRAPLLAFRTDGAQARANQGLPAEALWLIYPAGADLQISGDGRRTEIYGPMSGAWSGWQIHAWDLSEAWSVEVVRNDETLGEVISVAGRSPEADLVGLPSPYSSPETPLYLDKPPSIRFPLRHGMDLTETLGKWQIELSSVWDAKPQIQYAGLAREFARNVRMDDSVSDHPAALLPLACLLGDEPAGTYQLVVHGPGNVRGEFRFRLWPRLTVIGLPKRLLPAEQNNAPVTFTLRVPPGAACEAQAGSGDVQVKESMIGWDVTAGPDILETRLNLVMPVQGKPSVRVPVAIPVPRLRWALATEATQGHLTWTSLPLQRSAAALLQDGTASIHLRAHGLGALARRMRLELVELNGGETTVQEAELQKTVFSPDYFRIPLGQFDGSLRNHCQQGRFDLVIPADRSEPQMRLPLVLAPRNLEIQHVALTQVDPTTWKLTWQEDHHLRNRRFLLAPAWQPWQTPWEYKIPDEASGVYHLENVSIPPTRYHVYFYIAQSWEPAKTMPPSDVAPHVVDLRGPSERLAELEVTAPRAAAQEKQDDYLRAMVEKICIFQDIGDQARREETFSQILVPFNKLTNLRLMLGLLEWLDTHNISTSYTKFLWRSAFYPDRVKEILAQYKPADPLLIRYLSHVGRGVAVYGESALLIAERSDDPVVIHACLKHLLEKEEDILLLLVLDMIERARLSNRDAVDLLAQKPQWSVGKLAEFDPGPQNDRLLAALLPRLGQDLQITAEGLDELFIRVLPFETHSPIKLHYLETLVRHGRKEGFNLLIQAFLSGDILREELVQALFIDPDCAYQVLKEGAALKGSPGEDGLSNHYEEWRIWLADEFPRLAGLVHAGARVKTPVGTGLVDWLEGSSGNRIKKGRLDDGDFVINMVVGEGSERTRVIVNLIDNTLTFVDGKNVWGCDCCSFMHPMQRALDRHYKKMHPDAAKVYRSVPVTMPIDRESIILI